MLLDRYLPLYHYHEKHSIDVSAPRDAVYRAMKSIRSTSARRGMRSIVRFAK